MIKVGTVKLRDKNDFWNLPVGKPFVAMFNGKNKAYTLVTEKQAGSVKKLIHLYEAQDPRTPKITSYEVDKTQIVGINEGIVRFDKEEIISRATYTKDTDDYYRVLVIRSEAIRRHIR